jgi:hypothetical protein
MFLIIIYFINLSQSRLGLLVMALSVTFFFRGKVQKLFNFILPALVALMIMVLLGGGETIAVNARLIDPESNRADVWAVQLDRIIDNPFLGHPIGEGQRLGFNENSYLAAGVAVGVFGLILMGFFATAIFRRISDLRLQERRIGWHPVNAFCISLLGTSLVAAFFEAFFLGIFTFPLISAIYIAAVSNQLLQPYAKPEPHSSFIKQSSRRVLPKPTFK